MVWGLYAALDRSSGAVTQRRMSMTITKKMRSAKIYKNHKKLKIEKIAKIAIFSKKFFVKKNVQKLVTTPPTKTGSRLVCNHFFPGRRLNSRKSLQRPVCPPAQLHFFKPEKCTFSGLKNLGRGYLWLWRSHSPYIYPPGFIFRGCWRRKNAILQNV